MDFGFGGSDRGRRLSWDSNFIHSERGQILREPRVVTRSD